MQPTKFNWIFFPISRGYKSGVENSNGQIFPYENLTILRASMDMRLLSGPSSLWAIIMRNSDRLKTSWFNIVASDIAFIPLLDFSMLSTSSLWNLWDSYHQDNSWNLIIIIYSWFPCAFSVQCFLCCLSSSDSSFFVLLGAVYCYWYSVHCTAVVELRKQNLGNNTEYCSYSRSIAFVYRIKFFCGMETPAYVHNVWNKHVFILPKLKLRWEIWSSSL